LCGSGGGTSARCHQSAMGTPRFLFFYLFRVAFANQLPTGTLSSGEDEHRLRDYMDRWVEKENLEWACAGASFGASAPETLARDESYRDSPFSFPSSLFC
jgi:hypothetical protein